MAPKKSGNATDDESKNPTSEESEEDDTEDTEEEESDDTSEESDSEEGESEDEEESEGEVENKEVHNLFDPHEYPKSVQPLVKKAIAILTKKSQELSRTSKLLQEKATAFDELSTDDRFLALIREQVNGGESTKSRQRSDDDDDDIDDDTPATAGTIKKIIDKKFASLSEARQTEQKRAQMKQALNQEVADFKADTKNKGWEVYVDEVNALLDKRPGMTIQDAYDLVQYRATSQALKTTITKKKRNANIQKPSKLSGGPDSKRNQKKGVRGAAERAAKLLGISMDD